MPTLLPEVAAFRKNTGSDRWDEVWEGVLHMPPMPNRDHQAFEGSLYRYLCDHWALRGQRRVFLDTNVAAPDAAPWTKNYRVPDLVLLTADRFHQDKNEYFEGATVAVEIRSPGDEAYEKLEFYARVGVPEVWIFDRDTRAPSIFELRQGGYQLRGIEGGWLVSPVTGLRLRGGEGSLELQLGADESTRKSLTAGDY